MVEILVPIFVCVVLPVCIVGICVFGNVLTHREKMSVLMESIKHAENVDVDSLVRELNTDCKKTFTPRRSLNRKLLFGSGFTLAGLAVPAVTLLTIGTESLYLAQEEMYISAILLAVGLAFLITFFYSRHNIAREEREFDEMLKHYRDRA